MSPNGKRSRWELTVAIRYVALAEFWPYSPPEEKELSIIFSGSESVYTPRNPGTEKKCSAKKKIPGDFFTR